MNVLNFDRVTYRYPGEERLALDELTVALPRGEKIAVLGRNGSGKSTFFLHCNGLCRPEAGVVRFDGTPLAYDRASLRALRQRVGLVFQHADDQLFSASVAQDISFGPLNLDLGETEARRRLAHAAELCEITDLLERPTYALSGGEKARVALAGVLAMQPEVLIIDELLADLDPWIRLHILGILDRLHGEGSAQLGTILLTTHDLSLVEQWPTYLVMLHQGRAIYAGTPERLLSDRALLEETGLAQIWRNGR